VTLGKIANFNSKGSEYQALVLENYGTKENGSSKHVVVAPGDSEELIKKNEIEMKEIIEKIKQQSKEKQAEEKQGSAKKYNALALLRYASQRKNFLIMCYMWFCTSGVYYGLTINIKNLPGNTYITGIVMFVVEAVAYVLSGSLITIPFFGRKKSIIMFYAVSFVIYGVIIVFRIDGLWLTSLSLIARFCVSGVYNIIYTYSTEVYPTVVRSSGLGFNSVCGRVGGMVFPFILDVLHDTITYLFITLNLIALLVVFMLPETFGKPLTDSIPEETNKVTPDE